MRYSTHISVDSIGYTINMIKHCFPAFRYAQLDPVSIVFGVHMLIINQLKRFVIQLTLGLIGVVCVTVYSSLNSTFLAQCCYARYPPTANTYHTYGSCSDSTSLAYIQSDHGKCLIATPAVQIGLLICGVAAFICDLLYYLHFYRAYQLDVERCLENPASSYAATKIMMLLPISGILLGSYEHVTRFAFVFYLRLLFLVSIIAMAATMQYLLSQNYTWGCYPEFKYDDKGDIDQLDRGRCNNPNSAIYADTAQGHFYLWDTSLYLWSTISVVALAWFGMYLVRWTGWKPHIDTLPNELAHILGHTR